MIYTDGKPTICSKDTQSSGFGIRDYVTKKNWETELQGKKKSKVKILNITDLEYEEKQEELNKVFEGR